MSYSVLKSLISLALVSGLIAAGCGGDAATDDSSAQAQARDVAAEFSAAFGSGNVKKACALWNPEIWRGLPRAYNCEGIYGGDPTPFQNSFLTATVDRVVIAGGKTASVALSNDEIIRLKLIEDRWMVDDLGGDQNSIG